MSLTTLCVSQWVTCEMYKTLPIFPQLPIAGLGPTRNRRRYVTLTYLATGWSTPPKQTLPHQCTAKTCELCSDVCLSSERFIFSVRLASVGSVQMHPQRLRFRVAGNDSGKRPSVSVAQVFGVANIENKNYSLSPR